MKVRYPRVLIIANNCFSKSNSNGRTLGNLFYGWPKEYLAQMCIIPQDPNWDLCDNYYCMSDRAMLSAFIHFHKGKGVQLKSLDYRKNESSGNIGRKNVGKKTIQKVLLRELVWAGKRWNSKDFNEWVDSFNPEVIVLQLGDCCFMLNIVLHLSKSRNIPLIIYNTEGYYFFERNWHHLTRMDWAVFPFYRKYYRLKVEQVLAYASHSVYLNDKLKEDYDAQFHKPSTAIYNSSDLVASTKPLFQDDIPKIAYLGNLGLDRDSALIEVGEVLQQINSSYYIDVYGGASEDVEARLRSARGVHFHGRVLYDEVKRVISESDILFHVETEKGYKERQLQYAFSTKIADSVASGRCFVVYAPAELACSKYVKHYDCGWVASNKEELKKQLLAIVSDKAKREQTIKNALIVAEKNHNYANNAKLFQSILMAVERTSPMV